jgi:hypothetical protein
MGNGMNKRLDERFQSAVAGLVKATWALSILLGLLVVIPLFLWFAWARPTTLVDSVLVTLFCLSFGWVFVSMALCFRSLRKLGLDGQGRLRLFSGPRPSDPDELRAWRLGWQFMYAVLAVLLCIIAMPLLGHWTLKGF